MNISELRKRKENKNQTKTQNRLLLAQSLIVRRVSRKVSTFGTKLRISSVTRHPLKKLNEIHLCKFIRIF